MKIFLKNYLGSTCLIIIFVLAVMEVRFRIQDVKKHNEEVIRQEKRNLNVELCECLYISEYIYAVTEDKIYIAYMTFNENKLIQVLSYYNRNNGDGVALSVEDVMKEYDNFCNNTGSYDRLLALNEFCKDDVNKDLLEQYRVSMGDFYKKEYIGEKKVFDDTVYTGEYTGVASEEMWALCDSYFAWKEDQ